MAVIFPGPHQPFRPDQFPIHYGWVVAAAATIGVACSVPGQTIGVGVFTDSLMEAVGIPRTSVSICYMIGTLCSGFLVARMGRWLDDKGIRLGAVVSALGLGAGLTYLSQVDRLIPGLGSDTGTTSQVLKMAFVTLGFFLIRFFGQGLMTLASRNMIAKWFDRLRGRMTAISGIFASFLFSLSPLLFDRMIQGWGWRETWLLLAAVSGVCFAIFALFVFRDNPEECGLSLDAGKEPNPGKKVNRDNLVVRQFTRGEALRTYGFWIFNSAVAFQGFFITGYTFHILSVAADLEISREAALGAFLPASVMAVGISLFVGWLIDRTLMRYGLNVFAVGIVLIPVALALFPWEGSLPLLVLGIALSQGAFGAVVGTVWARYFGRAHLGAISGFNMSSMVLASACGPIAFSLSYDLLGGYRPILWFGIFCGAVLLVGSFFAKNPQRRLLAGDENPSL